MSDIRETATEQLRQASWWGGSGQALPELYVEQLITEIDRLKDQNKSLTTDIGLIEINLDHKATLLDSCEKALISRDEKADELNRTIEQQRHLNVDLNLHPIGSKWTHLETGYPVEVIAHSGGCMVVENISGYITGVWNDADFLAVSIKDLGHEEADRIGKESDNA